MKSNLILETLDNTIRLLKTGADVESGNVRLVWELAYKQHREYLEQKKKNELAVNEDDLEMMDKFNELIAAFFARFPKRVEVPYYVPPMIQPSWPPKEQKTHTPYLMSRTDGTGWEWNTGTNLPPTTYTTSTETGK